MLLEVVVCRGKYLKSVHRRYFRPGVYQLNLTFAKHSGDQIKKNELGGARCTGGREERYRQGFGEET